MFVPKSLLRRLYRKGSLKATDEGFELILTNNIATGTLTSPLSLKVDGEQVDPAAVTIVKDGEEVPNAEISSSNPIKFSAGTSVTVRVKKKLEKGKHTIEISANTREYGPISFDVEDELE